MQSLIGRLRARPVRDAGMADVKERFHWAQALLENHIAIEYNLAKEK